MSNIRLAYLLVVHKDAEQVNIFINQLLNYGDCDVYIHVDKKNAKIAEQIIKDNRVTVCSVYDVRWGSFEIVKAAYYLMGLAQKSGRYYTHMYFGSGQDLLVRKGLYEILDEDPNTIFIKIERKITNKDRASARYRVRWPRKIMIRNDMHLYRFIRIIMQLLCRCGVVINRNKRTLMNHVDFYEGRTWFIAPYDVMKYILQYIEENPDYVEFWEDSLAPDLMFFQTIIMNSPYKTNIKDELMYVKFGKTFRTRNHPLTITMKDVSEIENGRYYCARKFETDGQAAIQYFLNK